MTADLKESRLRFEPMLAGSSGGGWASDAGANQSCRAPAAGAAIVACVPPAGGVPRRPHIKQPAEAAPEGT